MSRRICFYLSISLIVTTFVATPLHVSGQAQAITSAYQALPLNFEANQGQSSGEVKFLARGLGLGVFFTDSQAVVILNQAGGRAGAQQVPAVLRISMVGGSLSRAVALNQLTGRVNYILGQDRTRWRTNIPTYAKIRFEDVYPGVDAEFYGDHRQLEYDFIVAPGADPSRISIRFDGSERITTPGGKLVLHVPGGRIIQRQPVAYQRYGRIRRRVAARYVWKGRNRVGLKLDSYDRSRQLIIDPVLQYSTYIGGSFQTCFGCDDQTTFPASDRANAIAVDSSRHAYIAGDTFAADYPTTPGAFIRSAGGNCHPHGCFFGAFVTKFSIDGTKLLYSTYLYNINGLEDNEEVRANGIAVDSAGHAFVTGDTTGGGYPTTPNAFMPATFDIFSGAYLTELNATGSDLLYSTMLTGPNGGSSDKYTAKARKSCPRAPLFPTWHRSRRKAGYPSLGTPSTHCAQFFE